MSTGKRASFKGPPARVSKPPEPKLRWRTADEQAADLVAKGYSPTEARLRSRLFDHRNKPPAACAVFSLAGISIATPGNLVAIASQVKTGKSAVVGAMLASTMSTIEGVDLLGFTSTNPNAFAVLHFDSEQSPYDHWHSTERTLRRAKISNAPDWLRSYWLTGMSSKESFEFLKEAIENALINHGGIHSIHLDGIADLVADVNDPAECNAFVAELQGLAIEHNCPIVGVIHFNPGGEKTRGHLGSQFERKAETNLRLDKDGDDVTTIWSVKQRRAPIPKDSGPCFAWSEHEGMHVSVENQSKAKAEARAAGKATALRAEAEALFVAQEGKAFKWGELIGLIAANRGLSKDGARKQFDRWRKANVITKNGADFYELSP